MKIEKIDRVFGRGSKNLVGQTTDEGIAGAIACLETFYYAFNSKDAATFKKVWLQHELIQLNNPLGGILRGIVPIVTLYDAIFNGPATVWVEFGDVVVYQSSGMVVFAGRESGEFTLQGETIDLQIRTSRIMGYDETEGQWHQLHHHGSIDNANLLDSYQKAVKKGVATQ